MMNYVNQFTSRISAWMRGQRITGGVGVIASARDFFDGCVPPSLVVKPDAPDDNIFINYAEVIVSKGVAFLFGEPLKISVGEGADKSGEEYLKTVWPEDARMEDFHEAATEGAISGDAYLKISIQADGKPRVTVGDPDCYTVETDPHDVTRALKFTCQYEIPGASADKPILYKEETSRNEDGKSWRIQEFQSTDAGKNWQTLSDNQWNFAFAPVFHCKNLPKSKSFYGRPDLREDVRRLITAISRLDGMCNKVVRVHSSPKPYATGLRKQDMEFNTEGVMFLPGGVNNVEAKIGLLEMTGDLMGARQFRKELREALSEMTRTPEVSTGKMENTGQLSGVALRILYGPLIDQTKLKQRSFGKMIKDCVAALLAIGGKKGEVALNWADPLPANEVEAVQVAEGKRRLGFSEQTLIGELGGDAAKEKKQRKMDVADAGTSILTAFDNGAGADQLAA
jgi:hypothetical protein